jgi:hypothetical protein
MSVTHTKQTNLPNRAPLIQEPEAKKDGQNNHVTSPSMRGEYRSAQLKSRFWEVPDDIAPLILKHAGNGVFKLALTCKYWNLGVREFLKEEPEGKKFLREKYQAQFRAKHGMSVVNSARALQSTSFEKFFDFDDSYFGKECIEQLKISKDPVYLVTPSDGHWLNDTLKSALASRGCKLTVFEIGEADEACMESLISALKAIPSNGFVALSISNQTLSSLDAAKFPDTISSHPIVAHIECNGDNALATGGEVVEWINHLSSKNANVVSFALNNCRIDEQNREDLSTLLSAKTGIVELEIFERETSEENVKNLADVTTARNKSAGPKLSLHFSANNLDSVIDSRAQSALSNNGISFRAPGQLWVFQDEIRDEDTTHNKSEHDDSSGAVGEPSSGDDDWGSEFEPTNDDSDVIVGSSSDEEV